MLIQANKGTAILSMSTVNLAEVFYISVRFSALDKVRSAIQKIGPFIGFAAPDAEQSLAAAELRHRYKLGLTDCFAAELSLRLGATLVTADPEFSRLGKQLKTLSLPRHSG